MFGVDSTELIIVAVFALIFIGPKELPQTMRMVGRWVGKVRGMARHFTSGIEAVIREAELEEMERKWKEENERIMRDFPTTLEAGSSMSAAAAIGVDRAVPAIEQGDEVALPAVEQVDETAEQRDLPLDDQSHLPPEKRELP